ncbi:GNAT family protein [Longimicrobium sp.]|uniref:GNAT family N-acetyltransferase n=1 Tax=Longimicrobium sp. TaxID=2029185 RepID=UPI002C988F21|nr:GNAT family protein [Longimicrobium sp.]HSU13398.1 GNAT family protein [Longimicrobium sp.]
MPPTTPYRIEMPRLVLRCWEPADAAALTALVDRNLEPLRGEGAWAEPLAPDARLRQVRLWRAEFDLDRTWRYAVIRADGGEIAGGITLFHRLGTEGMEIAAWSVGEDDGEMAEDAAAAAIRTALEAMEAPRVFTGCQPDDEGRIALWRGLGFTHDGTLRRLAGGRRVEEMLWSLLPGEWPGSRAAALAADARAFDALENRLF